MDKREKRTKHTLFCYQPKVMAASGMTGVTSDYWYLEKTPGKKCGFKDGGGKRNG